MVKHRMAPFVEEDLDEDEESTVRDIVGRCANERCFDFSSALNRRWMDRRKELSVSSIDAVCYCWSLSKGNRRDSTLNSVHWEDWISVSFSKVSMWMYSVYARWSDWLAKRWRDLLTDENRHEQVKLNNADKFSLPLSVESYLSVTHLVESFVREEEVHRSIVSFSFLVRWRRNSSVAELRVLRTTNDWACPPSIDSFPD